MLLVPLAMSTPGCARVVSDAPSVVCPVLADYSIAQQIRAADELKALPADAELRTFMADYGELRAEARACAGVKP